RAADAALHRAWQPRRVRTDLSAELHGAGLSRDLADPCSPAIRMGAGAPAGPSAERTVQPVLPAPARPAFAAGLCLARDHGLPVQGGGPRLGPVQRADEDGDRLDRHYPSGPAGAAAGAHG